MPLSLELIRLRNFLILPALEMAATPQVNDYQFWKACSIALISTIARIATMQAHEFCMCQTQTSRSALSTWGITGHDTSPTAYAPHHEQPQCLR